MTSIAKSLLKGAEEALKYAKNDKKGSKQHQVQVPDSVDVTAIRKKLHLSRALFSSRFGFNLRTLEKWEQGVRHPNGSARAYLIVIARNHRAVEKALTDNTELPHQP